MKKLFGGIDLTFKKLIIFAIITGVYTAAMAIIPFTDNTSFRDISIQFEWWILFGIIIICNSKSPKDSALKCFLFFLISQPLIYLLQVPFSHMGWSLFKYYKYWFMWTIATIPMGFIGYYIKQKNWLSFIILAPMLMFLTILGLGYFTAVVESFPHHLLSFIACFGIIVLVVLNIFDKIKLRIASFLVVLLTIIALIIIKGGILSSEFETYKTIDNYGITFDGEIHISSFSGTAEGNVKIVSQTDDMHSIKLNGRNNGKYTFSITDSSGKEYTFEYYYDKKQNTVLLNKKE